MERWSYKPEVEGLSPSLGTKLFLIGVFTGRGAFAIPRFTKHGLHRSCGSDVAGNMRVFQTRLESSNLSFRSKLARVAKRLRRWIANPVS